MSIRTTPALLTAVILLPLAACNRTGNDTATAGSSNSALGPDTIATASMAPGNAEGGAAATPLPLTAQAFVDAAASSDLYETGAARLADAGDHSAAIRSFAQMMMRDHAKSSAALKAAVAETNNAAKIDNQQLDPQHQAMLDELRSATPAQFSTIYARQQVAAHQKALAILQNYAKSGDSKPLMAFAEMTAPVVEQHLAAARKLKP
ncbi:MAG TPA: DUF4142 domain-containing protein [Novosphingobium sp.]